MAKQHLYRWFDREGVLLYVGISVNAYARAKQHMADKNWMAEAVTMTVEQFDTRALVERAEKKAIWHEHPRHNIIGQAPGYMPPQYVVREEVAPSATEKQIEFIQALQRSNKFTVTPTQELQQFSVGRAGAWIRDLKRGVNPPTESRSREEVEQAKRRLTLGEMAQQKPWR